jgi:hypothetical protein
MQLSEDILENLGFEHIHCSKIDDHFDCFVKNGFELSHHTDSFFIRGTQTAVHTIDELKSEYCKRTGKEL